MTAQPVGLREQKKRATQKALREAALRLAMERGPNNVRIEEIAEAAGVSPRTYNNYFSSRERAIVAAVTAERDARLAAAVVACPAELGLADALVAAVVDQYTEPDERADKKALSMITASPALRETYLDTASALEHPLALAIGERVGAMHDGVARVLAASVAAAIRIALEDWLQPADALSATKGFVVPSGSLPDRLRAAIEPLRPALDAAMSAR